MDGDALGDDDRERDLGVNGLDDGRLGEGRGTKRTETLAPVFSIASATEPKTGTSVPSKSTDVPALRGLTPPTMLVPSPSMSLVCFMPVAPVMPWTMTLLSLLRKIAMVCL